MVGELKHVSMVTKAKNNMTKKTFIYNKLIRDLTYDKIIQEAIDHKRIPCNKNQFLQRLKNKLEEETTEVVEAYNKKDLKEELADVLEVVHGFAHAMGLSFEDIEKERLKKLDARGGFKKGIVIHSVTFDENHPTTHYCLERPQKYPEVSSD